MSGRDDGGGALDPARRAALAEALALAPSDLDANRAGRLSEPQAERVRAWARRTQTMVTFALGAGAVFAVATAAATSGLGVATLAGGGAAVGFMLAMIAIVRAVLVRPLQRDCDAGAVSAVEGAIERRFVSYNGRGYSIWLGGRRFSSARTAVGRALRRGDRVRVHHLPRTRAIVAIEPLD